MRIEIILILVTGFIIANIYTDGKYMKLLLSWKKYYQMAGVAIGALVVYWLYKKNPLQAQRMVSASNDYLKYLPVDRNTSSILSPILDFTAKQNMVKNQYNAGGGQHNHNDSAYPIISMDNRERAAETKILSSGRKSTKRSVSETKKKYVASSQNWKCGDCGEQLKAWFETDHKVRLEYGGTNDVNNLVALCRECHGKKTAMENL
jgi:hypothetical protein